MPDNGNTRILHFIGYDLGKKVTLMLTFQPPNVRKLYQDEFPLCWGKSCSYMWIVLCLLYLLHSDSGFKVG